MKILLLSHASNDENAGASRVYHLLANALRQRGHAVSLYHYEDLRVPRLLDYFVYRMALPEFFFWRFYKKSTEGYDVIFCSNGMAHRIFRKLRTLPHRPKLIHHLHGQSYFVYETVVTERLRGHLKLSPFFMALKGKFSVKWDAKGAQHADVIVTQNMRDEDYLEDMRSHHPQTNSFTAPIIRVALPLHPSIQEASRNALEPEKRNPNSMLWFGSWVERKGNYYVDRAFRDVKKKFPDATLTLGGTGCRPEAVLGFFAPELRSSVRVLPRVDTETQIREYNAHSLFIFPSLSEGFGFALIEAMAMGLACVTTHTGMISDWLEDREHALVVAKASAKHLAQGIIRLMEDEALRCHVARTGQKFARQFTLEKCLNDYMDIFERRTVE